MDSQTVSLTVAELKNIPAKEDLQKLLEHSIITVTFKKLDGDIRIMTCTKNLDLIPEESRPKTNRKPLEGNINVWDLNAKGWRSFKYDRVTKVENK